MTFLFVLFVYHQLLPNDILRDISDQYWEPFQLKMKKLPDFLVEEEPEETYILLTIHKSIGTLYKYENLSLDELKSRLQGTWRPDDENE
jgi:hypothetical protein